jgi:hypothetical protein
MIPVVSRCQKLAVGKLQKKSRCEERRNGLGSEEKKNDNERRSVRTSGKVDIIQEKKKKKKKRLTVSLFEK